MADPQSVLNSHNVRFDFVLAEPLPVTINNGLTRLAVSIGVVLALVGVFSLTYHVKKLEIKLCLKDRCYCRHPDRFLGKFMIRVGCTKKIKIKM